MRRPLTFTAIAASVLLAGGIGGYLLWPVRQARTSGLLPQEAYVWQRAWTPGLAEAIRQTSGKFAGLCVLGAEVSFRGGRPEVAYAAIDWDCLKSPSPTTSPESSSVPPSFGVPSSQFQVPPGRVGIALRIGAFSGPFSADDETARLLADTAAELIGQANAAGVSPAELQIDFDAAESKLAGYRLWVEAIKRRVRTPAALPVVITALPSWLDRAAFKDLIASADGYVLQVHSLERPGRVDSPIKLCDPARVRQWVDKAARLLPGRPFRVALPTYSYLVAFDANGKYLGVSAEGPAPSWPAGSQVRELRADPVALAELVREWSADRPKLLAGLIWYRLPTSEDNLNWSWPTLAKVMAGQPPHPRLEASARRSGAGLFDIDLANAGDEDAPLAATLSVRWPRGMLKSSDAIGGFERGETSDNEMRLLPGPALAGRRLPPGKKMNVGWVLLDYDGEVQVNVTPMAN